MNHLALCFAKTPNLTPAKTRLAKDIGVPAAEKLYHLMVSRCLELMNQLSTFHTTIAVNEKEGLDHPIWGSVPTYLQHGNNLGEKLSHAESFFLASYNSIFFWGTDSPALNITHFHKVLHLLEKHTSVIIPAVDGGFVLYASRQKLAPGTWEKIRYSTNSTLSDLKKYLPADTPFLDQMNDLDRVTDINPIINEMNQFESQGQAWNELNLFLKNF